MADITQITKTPGKIVFDPTNENAALRIPLYSSDGITFDPQETLVELPNQVHGSSSQVVTGRLASVKLKPTSFEAAGLAKLFTHGPAFASRPGTSIIGATDKVIDIMTMDGKRRRLHNAFVFGEPAMTLEVGKTILGEVTIYGIVKSAGNSALLNDLYTTADQAWSDSDWDPDHEITPGWSASYSIPGTPSAWDDIETMGGFTITPKSELDEMVNNRDGLVNVTIKNYGVEARAKTFNISESLVHAARFGNGTQALGSRKTGLGRTLKLRATSGGAFVYIYGAVLQPNSYTFDASNTVVGDLTWKSDPVPSGGGKTHMLVTTTDPDV
jgi:hypothetical protein